MSHNPILSMSNLGRLDSVDVRLNTRAVLFSHNKLVRILNPGDKLTMDERLKGALVLYTIDCAPHSTSWRANLTASDEHDSFPVTVNMRYRVSDPVRMVEHQVADTEAMVARAIEPLLRRETRRYSLNRYQELEKYLEELLSFEKYSELGLELLERDVVINFSDADLERIKHLASIDRAMRFPQQTEHDAEFPSKDSLRKFRAHVLARYRVTDKDRLPTMDLKEAEEWLWRQVKPVLRRASRQYDIKQVAEAEIAMQEAVEDHVFSDHGLEIDSIQVEIEWDQKAQDLEVKKDELKYEAELAELQAKAEVIRAQRDLDKKRLAVDFYGPLIKSGDMTLLAMSLANNEQDAKEILNYLDARRREELELKLSLQREKLQTQERIFEKLLDKDMVRETSGSAMADGIIEGMVRVINEEEPLPALQKPDEAKALEAGQPGEQSEPDQEDN